jgi:hypothetical protein
VNDIQKFFIHALQNYNRVLLAAHESDELLIRWGDILESDPKFRLLKLPKSQLDRLLPAGQGGPGEIDISLLSNYLVELSALFDDRDSLLHTLKEQAKTYNILEDLMQVGQDASGDQYRQVVESAKASFQGSVGAMNVNLVQQTRLLYKIMQENDKIMQARDQSQNAAGNDSPIIKIEDALDEIDQFTKHLEEGKAFYEVVIPKLEKLHRQVEEASRRLNQERSDYEEYASRTRNEPVGRNSQGGSSRYGSNGGGSGMNLSDDRGSRARASSRYDQRPPASRSNMMPQHGSGHQPMMSHGGRAAEVHVDDEKVANLIALDFDPEKVVAALKKHDNDFEEALNELLSF